MSPRDCGGAWLGGGMHIGYKHLVQSYRQSLSSVGFSLPPTLSLLSEGGCFLVSFIRFVLMWRVAGADVWWVTGEPGGWE